MTEENFIFPILRDNCNYKQERESIKSFIKFINTGIRRICLAEGIVKHVTTYSARHSFATILRNSGIPIGFIKESLGHKNVQTTENYLNTYPEDAKRKYVGPLTDFLKPEA